MKAVGGGTPSKRRIRQQQPHYPLTPPLPPALPPNVTPLTPQVHQWRRWEEEAPASDVFLRISNSPTTPRYPPTHPNPGGGAPGPHDDRAIKRARASARSLWQRVGTSHLSHSVRVTCAVMTTDLIFSPVTRAVYYSLRLMFIDRLNLDHSFDFASFVERWG